MKNSWKKRVRIQIALQRNPHGIIDMKYREVSIEVIPGLRGICQEYGEDGFGEAWLNTIRLFMTEGLSRLRQERLL